MNSLLISVIIPVYNARPYLRRCLDSVLSQTYTQLEIILVDDGSTDGSGDICEEYIKKDTRIKVLHQENRGQSAARNAGLDIARGDCVGFVDADDWIYPHMYRDLLESIEKTGADIAQCRYICADADLPSEDFCYSDILLLKGPDIIQAAFLETVSWSLCDKLYRAELWKTVRLPAGYIYEDNLVLMDLFSKNLCLAVTDKIGYYYDVSGLSTTRGKKGILHMRSAEKLCRLWEEYIVRQKDTSGNIDMAICKSIPCYRWLAEENDEIDRPALRRHNANMHKIFSRHYRVAKKSEKYRAEPPAKKLLWLIYYCSPALSNYLIKVYHETLRGDGNG
ncbi:glycosyltransferase family 2 protein [Papillibacter cinnamivorans]|uniref:Glycosyl transferase family 2 n=1 Tax=Papillibacter cinnamivorans DSM 12816 TaxID=1122930 RepID=A0A1W2CEL0_9FIRM|nr:glycosyltransferase [Papillibacter cinnamivorans]SMC83685.1 Glycosyl transferase family 2 [Papillibacter cinnamivorans DSM 12816]